MSKVWFKKYFQLHKDKMKKRIWFENFFEKHPHGKWFLIPTIAIGAHKSEAVHSQRDLLTIQVIIYYLCFSAMILIGVENK